ncbi:CU044_5270 family protein [Paractinoplanes lichenicola]|uniref:CU044_5270 family protein n=1 Tax=Paractinoplanes lichenicola TaxID=2802976 RepID=A0ABS1VLL4_9ACTN|nr:CU044_5270 family protein [Actinoplanes lichenicola]MBL7255611.1 CU044_5270 family protein [Actinoplanes lichenicola]
MDEMSMLRETFETGDAPPAAAQQRARAALQSRIDGPAERRRWWRVAVPIGAGVATAAAVVAAFSLNGVEKTEVTTPPEAHQAAATVPYLKPVSAQQYFENAAWTAERKQWTDPAPEQFMYVETRELRNPPAVENRTPNGALVPGKAKYRTVQMWDRVDGQVQGTIKNGKLVVAKQGDGGGYWARLTWAQVAKLTTPAAVKKFTIDPGGPVGMDVDALAGQYVLPPAVQAAIFRYLAQQPGMKVNADAKNLDGRPAIGLGRILEGYLSQELLFDKQTYALIGERMIAVADHTNRADDGTSYTKKGDLFRQVMYRKAIIVDKPGETF